jgi:hypothetical protein
MQSVGAIVPCHVEVPVFLTKVVKKLEPSKPKRDTALAEKSYNRRADKCGYRNYTYRGTTTDIQRRNYAEGK